MGEAGASWVLGAARVIQGTAHSPDVGAGEVLSLLQQWYTSSMNVVCTWLTDRMDLQLHIYQLKTLIRIVKVISQRVLNTILRSEGACVCACMCVACSLKANCHYVCLRKINGAIHSNS